MKALTYKRTSGLGLLVLIAALLAVLAVLILPRGAAGLPLYPMSVGTNLVGLVCTEDPGDTFDLQAAAGYMQTPDGNSVYMWSYAPNPGSFQLPGPVLCVTEGDTVTINLTNNLPEPTSIIFPGQTGVSTTGGSTGLLTAEAGPGGGTVSYSFIAGQPGTYLYESGTEQHKQVHMGLYGAIVVRPLLGDNYAYNDPSTAFDREFMILIHEVDPELHLAVERGRPYDITTRHDRYWTINGRSMPDTLNDNFVPWMPAQPYGGLVQVEASYPGQPGTGTRALVRYLNAGSVNHPFHPHGNTMQVLGKDGRDLGDARFENFTTTLGAGQTLDLLFVWDDVESFVDGSSPIPVQVPGINDLIFKDGVTFYSGDPYLGQQGDLPVGVTSYNQCGEFYFPWHSHALNEFQNFDEGFGGLATVVRVDPPGGCN